MRSRCLMAATGLALGGFLAASASLADDTGPVPGVWQKHQYAFAAMGFTSTYSCDGLAEKLKRLLIASGARKDAKTTSGACPRGFGRPDKFARADLAFYTLAPDTAGTARDAPPINGAWTPITIAARAPRELGVGDCELVEQFVANVLPLFSARNIEDKTTCVPHQNSGSVINLKFEAFTVVAPPPAGPRAH